MNEPVLQRGTEAISPTTTLIDSTPTDVALVVRSHRTDAHVRLARTGYTNHPRFLQTISMLLGTRVLVVPCTVIGCFDANG